MEYTKAELKEVKNLATNIKSFLFESADLKRHKAGQHYDVKLTAPDGYTAERKYSVLNAPNDSCVVEFGIEILPDGEVSGFLDKVVAGTDVPVEIKGPLGGYFNWTPQEGESLMFIGGGSGIVPLLSMIFEADEVGFNGQITLLYGVKTKEDAIYLERLNEIGSSKNFKIAVAFSRESPENIEEIKIKFQNLIISDMRISRELIEKTIIGGQVDVKNMNCYICGRTVLVEDIAGILLGLGVEFGQIKTERYG